MKPLKSNIKTLLLGCSLVASNLVFSQGLIQKTLNEARPNATADTIVGCGSYELMEHIDKLQPGFLKTSNQNLKNIQAHKKVTKTTGGQVFQIPVVFHIVYHDTIANIHDSIIQDQLRVLNECYRRKNADTTNTRAAFTPIVADSKIEFVLATTDPNGNPTNGITRTYSPIKFFGGVLPYDQTQTTQINNWVNDSLYYNYFRITQDSLNGKSAWNSDNYINIWVGDLRIFEPKLNNFEELVFFGLSTPPANHPNWPADLYAQLAGFQEGILMHYPVIGSNNPNTFPTPYQAYNSLVKTGKMLVHETGHYLGLRHIWGDGDCTVDDFVQDTPNSNQSSNYTCNLNANNCVDTILGADLPNMIENYMDYSSADCQNSFTQGQIDVMRIVIENYRPNLLSVKDFGSKNNASIRYYPNPTSGKLTINFNKANTDATVNIFSIDGKLIKSQEVKNSSETEITLGDVNGLYIVQVISEGDIYTFKVLKQ